MEVRVNDALERALRAGPPGDAEAVRRSVEAAAGRADAVGLVDVAVARLDSPVGSLLAAMTPRGLVSLEYADGREEAILYRLAARVSPRVLTLPARLDPVRRALDDYFEGRLRRFDLPIDWSLTEGFTRRVLQRTAAIPYGGTLSYGEVAEEVGHPRASRAAGNALGANPIPIVVPCHRVLRAGGHLGGYGGGEERKRFLLHLEGVDPPA
jgi:methylated-DNA-[protein]-cysteine S-methyltransferase